MPLFLWKQSYELQLPDIDRQHRRLVELINDLYEAMKDPRGQSVLPRILEELYNSLQEHFRTEERIMRRCGYPEVDDHVEQHRQLGMQVEALVGRHQRGEAMSTPEVMTFLCKWLREHLGESDKAFGQFVLVHRGKRRVQTTLIQSTSNRNVPS